MMKFEGTTEEWLVLENIKIPAVVPLSFSKDKERLYALPGGLHVTASWVEGNAARVVNVFKTHGPKVCEYHR